MVADNDADANLWAIVGSGKEHTIQHMKTGKWLNKFNKTLILSENKSVWNIEYFDDFYKTICSAQQSYLGQNGENIEVSILKQEAKFLLKSYKFLLSLKDFSFMREDGIFAIPTHYSFLMEGSVDLKLKNSR